MKKVALLFSILIFALSSCNSDGELSLKDSYTFTVTQITSCSPNIAGYPQTVTSVIVKDNLTASEAKAVAEGLTSTTSTSTMGYTITVKTTCVYVLTKNYKKETVTGSREPIIP